LHRPGTPHCEDEVRDRRWWSARFQRRAIATSQLASVSHVSDSMAYPLENTTTLATDLRRHFDNWGTNSGASEAQRRGWPGTALPYGALGADAPRCLVLLEEDGHDGRPVGSCDASRAARFFSSTDHVFPPARDLVRLGVFFHLGLFRTLQLVVKNQWEESVLREKRRPTDGQARYAEFVTSLDDDAFARLLGRFRPGLAGTPGVDEIHLLLEEHGNLASASGFDRESLAALIDQMFRAGVLVCAANSPELECFEARLEQEIALLRDAAREAADQFWLKKSCWLTIQGELEDKLLLREDVRLRNFNVDMEWMGTFGRAYVELLEAQMRHRRLERRTAIARADPSLTDEDIEARVKESIEEELASLEKARGDAMHAARFARPHEMEGETLSDAQLDRDRDEAKRIIREIWRLTHPDTLNGSFTERQRKRLREYLEEVVKIRRSEALIDVRAIPVLTEILAKVRELYDVMGVDLEPASVIRGDTLAERIAWLENEIQKIEAQTRELMAEIHAMITDPDIREKRASLGDEEARKVTLLGLERLKRELEEKSVALEAEQRRLAGD